MSMPTQKPGKSRQDYQTPPEFLFAVKQRLNIGEFACDLAANSTNAVCSPYITEELNSLAVEWPLTHGGWTWLNPPYANIEPWVEKAAYASLNGTQTAMIVPASVGSNWWRQWVEPYAYVSYLNGRLTFVGETACYPKDIALLLYTTWGFTGHEIWRWK